MLKIVLFLCLWGAVQNARILGVFFMCSISHQVVFQPLWRELSLRGHQVTVITPNPLKNASLTNLTEIDVSFVYKILEKYNLDKIMDKDLNKFTFLHDFYGLINLIAEEQLKSEPVQRLLNDKSKEFDLILIEPHSVIMYGFAARFKAPTIGVSSLGVFTNVYDSVGNPSHPVLYPDEILLNYHGQLTLWERFISTLFSLWFRIYYQFSLLPYSDTVARKYFGDSMPHLSEIERNVSLLFLNVNPILRTPRPTVPAIIELWHMHIQPPKPLPKDLQAILDDAPQGCIYLSLGSNVKSSGISPEIRQTIISALSELPYKILWKWETDTLPNQPENVVTRKWFPQQDILAHRNIRAFITQGGLQSLQEAIMREVPLVAMPFMADQPANALKIQELGIGKGVDPVTVTKERLKTVIREVAENREFRKKIKEIHTLLEDQPMTGLERAVWWTEYVIRHKGAPHLRSPTADISWIKYLLVDLMAIITTVVIIFVYMLRNITRFCRKNTKVKLN